MKLNGHLWTQRQRNVQIMEKFLLFLLVVSYAPSVLTFNLEDYTKVITIDRHMDLIIFIWSIIIIYEHNSYDTLL